jgi:hypothetical protein
MEFEYVIIMFANVQEFRDTVQYFVHNVLLWDIHRHLLTAKL